MNVTFSTLGASSCYVCPAGYQCTKAVLPDPCPAGFYCPEGTGYDTQPCPVGTIGNRTGLANESECTQCPGGFYCETSGRATVTGLCKSGQYYICSHLTCYLGAQGLVYVIYASALT